MSNNTLLCADGINMFYDRGRLLPGANCRVNTMAELRVVLGVVVFLTLYVMLDNNFYREVVIKTLLNPTLHERDKQKIVCWIRH